MPNDRSIITLTTDFGESDPYVGSMKGVLLSICPSANLVDLSHNIPSHDIRSSAFFLSATVPHFPAGSIHLIVVDPGVGTDRHPIAVSSNGSVFICPDNGILTLYCRDYGCREARIISNPGLMMRKVSQTFHGRDVFAPAAAHLACGVPFEDIGPILDEIKQFGIDVPRKNATGEIVCSVVYVDKFGNLITNLHRDDPAARSLTTASRIIAGERVIEGLQSTYGQVSEGDVLALWGSTDYLEIAVNRGNAEKTLGVKSGGIVTVIPL